MSFTDDHFRLIEHTTNWWDFDTPSNASFMHARAGLPSVAGQVRTRAERIAGGTATPEDLVAVIEANRQHREWLASPLGQAWLKNQT